MNSAFICYLSSQSRSESQHSSRKDMLLRECLRGYASQLVTNYGISTLLLNLPMGFATAFDENYQATRRVKATLLLNLRI